MAETSLRAYVREIDEFIEHDQLDEAIAHARHILQTYPRHLDTYRLLGKAYLEAKRYGDAADIFQRVLSAAPDDFVAHVGMSVVREDEGNIDAAIWHMERAFETNPSNAAVQGELRRLIGRRDGLEPHKVRLTRGALARMYANGDLYPQAIAELHAALQEDLERPDLQVLLADMYWRTNQRAEAGEVASAVLETLPNCREANRILAAALHSQGRTEEALTYHRRVAALDPYSALVESIQDDPARVEANAVRIEKLAWMPGVGVETGPGPQRRTGSGPLRPSWLDSLGAATATGAAAAASKERREREAAQAPEAPPAAPERATEPEGVPADSAIPDWMEAAGWKPGTGEAQEGPVSFSDDELRSLEAGMLPPEPAPEPEDGLARADIPDWLKDVAPPDASMEASEEPIEESAPAPEVPASGLEEPRLPQGWSPPPAAGAEPEDDDWLKAAAEDAPALPTWMEEQSPGATATIVTWLGDRSRKEAAAPEAEQPIEDEAAQKELPEWLAEQPVTQEPEPTEAPTPKPGWLSGLAAAAAVGSSIEPEDMEWPAEDEGPIQTGMYPEDESAAEPAPEPAELPEWLQTIAGGASASQITPREDSPAGPTPEWLQPPRETAPSGEAGADEGFGWLRELAESEPPTPKAEDMEAPEPSAPSWMAPPITGDSRAALGQSAGPEWLRGIAEPESAPAEEAGSEDWLRGIAEPPEVAAESQPAEASLPVEPEAKDESAEWLNLLSPTDTQPQPGSTGEWLRLLKQDGVPAQQPESAGEPASPTRAPAAPAGDMDDEQVFDWLESLAAKQGIPAPEAIPPAAAAFGVGAAMAAAPPPPEQPAKAIPDEPEAGMEWLEELAAERGREAVPTAMAPIEPEVPPTSAPEVSPHEAGPPVPGVPPLPKAEPAPPAEEPMPEPEAPDWLMELVAEASQPEVEPEVEAEEPAPTDETLPSLPDWMLAGEPAEEEPTIPPLPPVAAAVSPAPEPEPVPEAIDELAETWVPPWEQLAIEEPTRDEPPPPVLEAEEPEVEPIPSAPEPAFEAQPEPEPEPVPAPPRYREPTTDVLEEVPDWLRAKAPRPREEPQPLPAEPEQDLEIPEWLTPAAAAPPKPPRRPAPEPIVPEPEPAPEPEPVREPVPQPVTEARRPEPVPPPLPPAAAAPEPPRRAPKAKPAKPGIDDKLHDARHALALGDFRRAANGYSAVIKKKYKLEEVTSDLETALDRNPSAPDLWQALGDAYMKSDRLEDAIEAYERGVSAA